MNAGSSRPDFSQLANRWWGLTNNLVATSVILLVSLVFGREVVHGWWSVRAPQALQFDEEATRPELPIAGPFVTSTFAGNSEAATQVLAEQCRERCVHQPNLPPVGTIPEAALAAGRALGKYDRFEIYLAEGEPPMLAAVALQANATMRDVYCWGFALPADEQDVTSHWNLYISAPGKTPAQEQ